MKQDLKSYLGVFQSKDVFIAVAALSLGSSALFVYWKPELFSWQNALPATLTYYLLFVFVLRELSPILRIPWGSSLPGPFNSEIRIVLFHFILFVLIGVILGFLSGSIWWITGGHEMRDLPQALKGGAYLGGVAIVVLFTGYAW